MDPSLLGRASEYLIVMSLTVVGLWLLYWLGGKFCARRSRSDDSSIESINKRYKDMVQRESQLQQKILDRQETIHFVEFLLKACGTAIALICLFFFRNKSYFIYFVQEMPHFTITLPLAIMVSLYLLHHRLAKRVQRYKAEHANLKPQMREQEKLLRDTVDPQLYETFKRIILREEKANIERIRIHQAGCTAKCRVKNSALELDLERNKALVECLTTFDWGDRCVGGLSGPPVGPPSGSKAF